jgi:hypothetical protein
MLINGLLQEVIEKLVDVVKSYARSAAIQNHILKLLAGLIVMNQQKAQILVAKRLSGSVF